MLNSLLNNLKGLQERNAMEVLPEVDQMIEALNSIKESKVLELRNFASKYGVVIEMPKTEVKEVIVETKTNTEANEEAYNQIIEKANQESALILEKAKEEANALIISTRDDLEAKVTAMLESAEIEAEDIRSGAKIEANFIIDRANKEAEEIITSAEFKAMGIVNEAVATAANVQPQDSQEEEETIEVAEEITEEAFDVSDVIVSSTVDTVEAVEESDTVDVAEEDVEINTSATCVITSMEQDRRHENAHVGTANIGDRLVVFHSAPYMDLPMVYDACEGDEELVKEAILASNPNYFKNTTKTYRYIDYTAKEAMYVNSDDVYVGYVDGYAISWSKDFTVPSYLRYKYVNKKGFKPANKPDFISKVQALVEKYNAGLKAYEAEMAEAKAINQSLNYTVFSNRTSDIEIDVVMEATTVSDALAAFADME